MTGYDQCVHTGDTDTGPAMAVLLLPHCETNNTLSLSCHFTAAAVVDVDVASDISTLIANYALSM